MAGELRGDFGAVSETVVEEHQVEKQQQVSSKAGKGKRLWKKVKYQLVEYHSLPGYLRDNEYILGHYRAEWPPKQIILSIFTIHNETLNVWTRGGRGSPPVLPPDIRFRPKIEGMHLTVEYGGGLELLCDSVKVHDVDVELPVGAEKLTMRDLLIWVQKNLIKERPEMFIKGDTLRPGILVLVNDCDWELSGQLDTALEEKDVVVFISTLHGG